MLIDFHIHTDTSSDADQTIRQVYEAAAEKGLKHICITSHHETSEFLEGDMRQSLTDEDIERCRKEISELNNDGKVMIFQGVELSYIEGEEEYMKRFIEANDFDFVMGTLHYVHGLALGNPRLEGNIDKDPAEMYREYFRLTKKMISTGLFDVIAHPDLPKRVMQEIKPGEARREWEEIGELLVKTGTGFEINTCYHRKIPGGTYPDPEIIRIFLQKGVRIITIGSDSHHPEHVGRNVDQVEELLRSLGVKEIYRFEKRKAIPVPLG